MKIIYKHGNLLESGESIIAHSCNVAGGFGSGVAGAIAKKYPKVKEAYHDLHTYGHMVLGANQLVLADLRKCIWVINMFCQPNYGYDGKRYVSYDAVDLALKDLDSRVTALFRGANNDVAFPLFGTHLGGGKWKVLSALLEENSKNFQPIVYSLDGKIPE